MQKLSAKQEQFIELYKKSQSYIVAAYDADFVFEKLQKSSQSYYVYFLADPSDGLIFYVGKGKGRRMYQHVKNAISGDVDNSAKYDRIKKILDAGGNVMHLVFAVCDSEDDAYDIEGRLIEELAPYGLTNIAHGIVTENKQVNRRAKYLLDNMMSYTDWAASCPMEVVRFCAKHFGSMAAMYEQMRNDLEELIRRTE